MSELRTDFKDDVLDVTQNEKRKYRIIHNDDGTISLEDATVYLQKGDSFGANDINEMNGITNQMLGVNEKLEEINRHPKTSLTSEEGTHNLRYNEKQLQVKENDNWVPATVDMVYGNGKKITKIRYGQKITSGDTDKTITLPEDIKYQKAIVHNDLIYAFSRTKCYVFDGVSVLETLTLPATISDTACIHEWENQIHIFSGTNHYKFDGQYWLTLDTLPYSISGRVVLHKGELHFVVGVKHYKYDGESWTQLSDVPRANTNYSHGVAFDYEGVLYSIQHANMYKYDDDNESWTLFKSYNTDIIGVDSMYSAYTIIDDKLYIGWNQLKTNSSYASSFGAHACIDLKTFTATNKCSLGGVETLATSYSTSSYNHSGKTQCGTYITYKGVIYSLTISSAVINIYKNDCWWRAGLTAPLNYSTNPYKIVEYNGETHIIGIAKVYYTSAQYQFYTNHIKRVNGEWVDDVPSPVSASHFYCGLVIPCSDGIHIMGTSANGASVSDGSSHYVFNGETWTKLSDLPASTAYIHAGIEFRGKLHLVFWNGSSSSHVGRLYALENTGWEIKWTWSSSGTSNNCGPCITSKQGLTSGLIYVFNDRLYITFSNYLYIYGGDTIERTGTGYKICNIPYYISNEQEMFVFGIAAANADSTSSMTSAGRLKNGKSFANQTTVSANDFANWWIEDEKIYIIYMNGYAMIYNLTHDMSTVLDVECEE